MYQLGIAVFTVHFLFILAVESCRRTRTRTDPMSSRERTFHLVDVVGLMGCAGAVSWVKYSTGARPYFFLAIMVSILVNTAAEFFYAPAALSVREKWLNALLYSLRPVVVLILAVFWPFAQGVPFFLNIVLPFNTDHLQLVSMGYFCCLGGLLIYRGVAYSKKLVQPAPVHDKVT